MISQQTIADILEAANIKDVISDYVTLKKNGGNWVGVCPFHNEKTGSFTVNETKKIYKCFGCGKAGNAIGFLMAKGIDFIDAVKQLGDRYGINVDDNRPKEYIKPVEVKIPLTEKAIEYFTDKRKISKNTLLRFKLSSKMEFMPQEGKEQSCILFKYYRDEELVNIKYRDGKKNFKLEKGAELIFYNLDAIKITSSCIITEGEIDCLTAYECGFHNVVSVPNGASKGTQRLEYLDNCIEYFVNKEQVIIATDSDSAGLSLRDELTRRIGVDKCLHVTYPSGCKDLNDVLVKLGKEAVIECLKSGKQPPITGIITVADVEKDLYKLYYEGMPQVDGIDWPYLDEIIKFATGRLTAISGIPNSGKSDFLDQICIRLANRRGWNFGVFSPERWRPEIHVSKLSSVYVGMPFFKFPNRSQMSEQNLAQAKDFIENHFYFFNVEEIDCTIDGILAKGAELVTRFGINALIIDPYNYVESKRPPAMSETEYVSYVLGKIKMFAYKYSVHIFIVAHPTKIKKKSDGTYEVPSAYDISGSANWFNKPDNIMIVYRHDTTGLVDVFVQKAKYVWEGKKGFTTFKYDPYTFRYATEFGEFEQEYRYVPFYAQPSQEALDGFQTQIIKQDEPF